MAKVLGKKPEEINKALILGLLSKINELDEEEKQEFTRLGLNILEEWKNENRKSVNTKTSRSWLVFHCEGVASRRLEVLRLPEGLWWLGGFVDLLVPECPSPIQTQARIRGKGKNPQGWRVWLG